MQSILFWNFVAVLVACSSLWAVSVLRRDVSIVDIYWGFGFVMIAWLTLLMSQETSSKANFLVLIVTLWACGWRDILLGGIGGRAKTIVMQQCERSTASCSPWLASSPSFCCRAV